MPHEATVIPVGLARPFRDAIQLRMLVRDEGPLQAEGNLRRDDSGSDFLRESDATPASETSIGRQRMKRPARRATRLLAAVCALALAGLWGLSAQAQTTLVGNTGKRALGSLGSSSIHSYAQPFTTGSSPNGYSIDSIVLDIATIRSSGLDVSVWSSNAEAAPSMRLFGVEDRSTVGSTGSGGAGLYKWSAPANAVLEPDTTYHIVVAGTSSSRTLSTTIFSGEDAGSASGWDISSRFWLRGTSSSSWSNGITFIKFQVRGSEIQLPTVSIASGGGVSEAYPASFTLTLSAEISTELEIQVSISETGDMVASGEEGERSVTIAAGSNTATLALPTQHDFMDEPNSDVSVAVREGAGYQVGSDSSATVTVVDNDGIPTMWVAGGAAAENAARLVFEVSLFNPSWMPVSVDYEIGFGTATLGQDYTAPQGITGTLTFSPGVTERAIQLNLQDDSFFEGSESVAVVLSNVQGDAILIYSWAIGTIFDNEDQPEIRIGDSISPESGRLSFSVGMTPASSEQVVVGYEVAPSTAQTADYTGATSGRLSFSPGEVSKNIQLMLVDDSLDEVQETVSVRLSVEEGTAILADGTANGVITDNDVPEVSIADATAREGANLAFGIAISTAPAVGITVTYSLANVSAGSGDHSGAASGSVTFPAGDGAPRSIAIATAPDNLNEPDETLTITLDTVTPGGAATLGTAMATGTIVNTSLPVVSIAPATAIEGSNLAFAVAISAEPAATVSVPYTVALGTAQAADHSGPASGIVLFPAGLSASQTVSIGTVDDNLDEANETLTVMLGEATPYLQATVDSASSAATGTIVDNDVPVVSIADATATEGSDLEFTVSISTAPVEEVTVAYTLALNTAEAADLGHFGDTGSATFGAGASESQTISIPTVSDQQVEQDETLAVELGPVSSGEATIDSSARTASGTILDDDENQLADGVVVSGEAKIDSVLTAVITDISDGNGVVNATFGYQWQRSDADLSGFADIAGETSFTYRLTREDFQKSIRVLVSFVDDHGNAENPASPAVKVEAADHVLKVSANEAVEGEEVVFEVTLQRAPEHSGETVEIDYELRSVGVPMSLTRSAARRNASCGADAVQCDTLTFMPGDTMEEVRYEIPDNDEIDSGERRLVLELTPNVSTANSSIGINTRPDPVTGLPAGTIRIADDESRKLPREAVLAFLHAEVGRTVASGVVNRVWERVAAHRAGNGSSHARVGSHTLEGAAFAEDGASAAREFAKVFGVEIAPAPEAPAEEVHAISSGNGLRSFRDWAGVPSSRDIATRSRFNLALGGQGGKAGSVSLWGASDLTSFSSRLGGDGVAFISPDGTTLSGFAGIDVQPHPNLLLGLAASRSRTKVDFVGEGGDDGRIVTEVDGAHPYLHLALESGGGVWASVGGGGGQSTLADGGSVIETDISMRMLALGIRSAGMTLGNADLAVKADVFTATIKSDGDMESGSLRPVEADSSRARLAVEGTTTRTLASGAVQSGVYELGARMDGGDAERGGGADVAAKLFHTSPDGGLELALHASALLVHEQNGFDEWGIGVGLSYRPDAGGRGLHMSINPSWGILVSDAAESGWTAGPNALEREASSRGAAVDARLGYGVGVLQNSALMTMYGEADAGEDGSRIRIGADVRQPTSALESVHVNLFGERRELTDKPENRVMLEAGLDF